MQRDDECATAVYGPGFVWTNPGLGLEPVETLLAGGQRLAAEGVVPGVSVLAGSAGRPMPDGRTPHPGGWNRIRLLVTDIDAEVVRLLGRGRRVPRRGRRRPR